MRPAHGSMPYTICLLLAKRLFKHGGQFLECLFHLGLVTFRVTNFQGT